MTLRGDYWIELYLVLFERENLWLPNGPIVELIASKLMKLLKIECLKPLVEVEFSSRLWCRRRAFFSLSFSFHQSVAWYDI